MTESEAIQQLEDATMRLLGNLRAAEGVDCSAYHQVLESILFLKSKWHGRRELPRRAVVFLAMLSPGLVECEGAYCGKELDEIREKEAELAILISTCIEDGEEFNEKD